MGELVEVMDGVYRIRLEPIEYIGHVNCYLLRRSANSFLLVDTGTRQSGGQLVATLRSIIGRENRIDQVLLSHMHPDHYGGTESVLEAYKANLLYHADELRFIDLNRQLRAQRDFDFAREYGLSIDSARRFQELTGEFLHAPGTADFYPRDGGVIGTLAGEWSVIHTPGHSPGHVCLFNKANRVMISGDHVLPKETPNIPYLPLPGYSALEAYVKSLLKIRNLSPGLLLPAHGDAFSEGEERISYILEHHRARLKEIFELMAGHTSLEAIASGVRW